MPNNLPGTLLLLLVATLAWTKSAHAIETDAAGFAYTTECEGAGVPVPPPFTFNSASATGWTYTDEVSSISLEGTVGVPTIKRDAHLFYWVDHPSGFPEPRGVCMAFPRTQGTSIDLLGVICQSALTSRSCFWDIAAPIGMNDTVCYSDTNMPAGCTPAIGGAGLPTVPGGVCSDCHSGENAFIIHGGHDGFSGLPDLTAINWVEPVVKNTWPQDTGPANYFFGSTALQESCLAGGCHGSASRNRFPELSKATPDFCSRLLGFEASTGLHNPERSNVIGYSMPLGAPDEALPPQYYLTFNALISACSMPAGAGRLARGLYHHHADRAPSTLEAELVQQLRNGGMPLPAIQDTIARPSLERLAAGEGIGINGELDPLWTQRSLSHAITTHVINSRVPASDLSAEWRAMWDDQYLYVFVDVTDPERQQNSGNLPYLDDSVEIYVDGHSDRLGHYDWNDFQFLFRPGDGTVYVGGGRTPMSNTGVLHGSDDTPNGYTIEVAIPWTTLGVAPGGQIGFEIHVNDDDGGPEDTNGADRDNQVTWRTVYSDAWTNPSRFTRVDLAQPLFSSQEFMLIDGLADEAIWFENGVHTLERRALPIALSNNSAIWDAHWDDENLYFFVSVDDESVLPPDGPTPYHDDSIEISIDANNGHEGFFDGFDDFQFIFPAGVSQGASLGDASAWTDVTQIDSAAYLTATGYDLEVAIPWSVLKTTPVHLATLGVEVQINDDDFDAGDPNGNPREGKLAWCADNNNSYYDSHYFCVKKLVTDQEYAAPIPQARRNRIAQNPWVPGGITIDGEPVDPAFGAAPVYEIVNQVSGSPSATGTFRSVWNQEYLYFFVQVFDDDSPVSNSGNLWYLDDSVEIYIDGNYSRDSGYDRFDVQYMFRPFEDEPQVGYYTEGFLGTQELIADVEVASGTFAGGYYIEAAIPWHALHIVVEPELRLGIEVQINDDDTASGPDRDGKVAWAGTELMGDLAWVRTDAFRPVYLMGLDEPLP